LKDEIPGSSSRKTDKSDLNKQNIIYIKKYSDENKIGLKDETPGSSSRERNTAAKKNSFYSYILFIKIKHLFFQSLLKLINKTYQETCLHTDFKITNVLITKSKLKTTHSSNLIIHCLNGWRLNIPFLITHCKLSMSTYLREKIRM